MASNIFPPISSDGDLDLKEVSTSSSLYLPPPSGLAECSSSGVKLQIDEPVLHGATQDLGSNFNLVSISSETTVHHKNNQPVIYNMAAQNLVASSDDFGGSSTSSGHQNDASEFSKQETEEFLFYNQDEDEDYLDYDDEYEYAEVESDFNYSLSAKFDDMNIPPGVEVTVPWLTEDTQVTQTNSSSNDPYPCIEEEIDSKFKLFKQFDTVQDFSDHCFVRSKPIAPAKDWAKRIQHEWKLLENDLPENILVRVYEERMDLLRAVIVGPDGTPYHDGLFFFDAQFPSFYPQYPPNVYYHSGGLCLNPNLHGSGNVCLSLLGTSNGEGCENWNPSTSTMLQVLVSIQALVLNKEPYFNDPGFEATANTTEGIGNSLAYNKVTFVLSLRTMLYSLRNPPKHFSDFVAGHFCKRGHTILAACKAYMEGIQVGSAIKEEEEEEQQDNDESLDEDTRFRLQLKQLYEELLMKFTVQGANCEKFIAQKVTTGEAKTAGKT